MNFTTLYSSSWLFRSTLKTVVFLMASSVAVVSLSVGYGLLKVLLLALSSGTRIGIAETMASWNVFAPPCISIRSTRPRANSNG